MTDKWTPEKELNLITLLANNKSFDEISNIMNRTKPDILLRLQKIIYENYISGKTLNEISAAFNLSLEDITKYFTLYDSYVKKYKLQHTQDKNVQSINIPKNDNQTFVKNNALKNSEQNVNSKINNKIHQLEMENKFLETIIANKKLKLNINKLVNAGIIDKDIKIVFDKYKQSL